VKKGTREEWLEEMKVLKNKRTQEELLEADIVQKKKKTSPKEIEGENQAQLVPGSF
jgi:hypothetical protein